VMKRGWLTLNVGHLLVFIFCTIGRYVAVCFRRD
jgi:hypothetical protein